MDNNFTDKKHLLKILFEKWSNEDTVVIEKLPQSGSSREYFRLESDNKQAIGVFNNDSKENVAFIEFSKHFLKQGLKVPEVYSQNIKHNIYIQEDLGNETLYSILEKNRKTENYPDIISKHTTKVVQELPKFQFKANQGLDYSNAYPRKAFDKQSMQWDLNYFKYYFLKLAEINFDEQELENDFQTLIEYLLNTDSDYFLFRDFQTRNIMMIGDEPWFIDYQGGRKGALQYDLASLLYDSKANIPQQLREKLLDVYIKSAKKYFEIDGVEFKKLFYPFALIRIMQAMGAYGFRGFYEKKSHFLESIPFAIKNLTWILNNVRLDVDIPHLQEALRNITQSKKLKNIATK